MANINKDAKKRVIKLLEHYISKNSSGENILTPEEEHDLFNSFITNEDLYTFEFYKGINEQIRYAVSYFVQIKLICFEHITQLMRYIEMYNYYQKTEYSINSLIEKFDNPEQQKLIIDHFIETQDFELTRIVNIENKNILFDTISWSEYSNDNTHTSLQDAIELYTDTINSTLKEYKTIAYAIREYIKSSGLNVKSYLQLLDDEKSNLEDQLIELDLLIDSHPYLSNLMDYDDISTDDVFYEDFKAKFLTIN